MRERTHDKAGYDVTCAGHLCLDITPEFQDVDNRDIGEIFYPGTLIKVGQARLSTGGSVGNTGVGCKVLGMKVALMALAGKDEFGSVVRSLLARHALDAGISQTERASTSYAIVISPPGNDRFFLHDPGANDLFCSEHLDYSIVSRSKIFHLGYPTVMKALYSNCGAELTEIFRRVKELGVTTSLDLALADPSSAEARLDWREIFRKLLPFVDLFLPSIEESFLYMYPERYLSLREKVKGDLIDHIDSGLISTIGEEFLDYGCGACMLKAGPLGIYLRTGTAERLAGCGHAAPADPDSWAGRELWCPAYEVERIVNATGAGDVSIAAFLGGLLNGWPLERCLKTAVLTGFFNLQSVDSSSGLKRLDECFELLETAEPPVKNIDRVLGSSWCYDNECRLYRRRG